MERLPHIDHYRNVMSMAGAMASRPTLLDLHGEDKEPSPDLEMNDLQLPEEEVSL